MNRGEKAGNLLTHPYKFNRKTCILKMRDKIDCIYYILDFSDIGQVLEQFMWSKKVTRPKILQNYLDKNLLMETFTSGSSLTLIFDSSQSQLLFI